MAKAKVEDIQVGTRHRTVLTKIDELAASIAELGLLHPIVVTPDKKLIAGRRRLAAFKHLKRDRIDVHTVDIESIVRGERAENFERVDFAPEDAKAIADAIGVLECNEAKQRQGTRTDLQPSVESTESKRAENEARNRTAKAVGMSWQKLQRIGEIVDSGDEKLIADMNRTGRVAGVHKKLTVQQQAAKIAKEPPAPPKGPFRVIVADPPWTYFGRAADASHRAANPYASMTLEDITDYLPKQAPTLAAPNCVLWLWTTNSHMREAFEVVEAWDFTQKTILTWVKQKMGIGDWLRGQTEHCLMAVRGKPTVTLTNQTTVLHAAAGKHSAKPDEFYDLVVSLCPGSKVELFGRKKRESFIVAGLEA